MRHRQLAQIMKVSSQWQSNRPGVLFDEGGVTALSGELSRVVDTPRSSLSDRDLLNGEKLLRLRVVELCGVTVLNI